VIYNFRDGLHHDNPPKGGGYNVVGNYYKRGPSDAKIFPFCFQGTTEYFLRDNYIDGVGIVQDPWAESDKLAGLAYYAAKGKKAARETAVPYVTTQSPQEAYDLVLRQAGGLPRDAVTARIVAEVRGGTGSWGKKPQDDLLAGLQSAAAVPQDADNDGLPDDWEASNQLDRLDASDSAKPMPSGYPAIEEYANELAARFIEATAAKRQ